MTLLIALSSLSGCDTPSAPPPEPVSIAVPISLSRDGVPEGAIDVAIDARGVFVDGAVSDALDLPRDRPVGLRVDGTVPYATVFTVVEHLADREIFLVVAGSSGPAAIPLGRAELLSEELDLTVLMSPDAFIARIPEQTQAFPGHDHAGLRTWLTTVSADHPESHRATLVPHSEASTEELVRLADTVRAAGFQRLVLAKAL